MKFLTSISLGFLFCFLGCGDDGSGLDWSEVADGSGNQMPQDSGKAEGGGDAFPGDTWSPGEDGMSSSDSGSGGQGGEGGEGGEGGDVTNPDVWEDAGEGPIDIPECMDDLEYFETYIWGDILSIKCAGCHNAQGTAKDSSMLFNDPALPGSLEENFETFAAQA